MAVQELKLVSALVIMKDVSSWIFTNVWMVNDSLKWVLCFSLRMNCCKLWIEEVFCELLVADKLFKRTLGFGSVPVSELRFVNAIDRF